MVGIHTFVKWKNSASCAVGAGAVDCCRGAGAVGAGAVGAGAVEVGVVGAVWSSGSEKWISFWKKHSHSQIYCTII